MLECSRHRRRREPQTAGQRSFAGRPTLRYIHLRRIWSPVRCREIRSPSPKTRAPRVTEGSRTCNTISGAFTGSNLLRDPGFSYTMPPFMSELAVSQRYDLFTSPTTHDVSVIVPLESQPEDRFVCLYEFVSPTKNMLALLPSRQMAWSHSLDTSALLRWMSQANAFTRATSRLIIEKSTSHEARMTVDCHSPPRSGDNSSRVLLSCCVSCNLQLAPKMTCT